MLNLAQEQETLFFTIKNIIRGLNKISFFTRKTKRNKNGEIQILSSRIIHMTVNDILDVINRWKRKGEKEIGDLEFLCLL